MTNKLIEQVTSGFRSEFKEKPQRYFFSPGRINLIGEHTDYNGGHVFPCAITLGIYAAVGPRTDSNFHLYSASGHQLMTATLSPEDLKRSKQNKWSDYFCGMVQEIVPQNVNLNQGLNIYLTGNLPSGAGLSSSAALELLFGIILSKMYDFTVSMSDLIHAGQRVENNYLGLNSGIMDQFAIGMGRQNQAILLDTKTMKYEYFPLELADNLIVIMNTNKPRSLVNSKYNERRQECELALKKLQKELLINSLGELTNDQFDEYTYLIGDKTLIKRARHAVFENQRTLLAAKALKAHQIAEFGRLISASGISLAYDYEVTGKELDTLVQTALQLPGVLGSRMVGAGFGGCAIALVNQQEVANFLTEVQKTYTKEIGHAADFYLAKIADGPHEIKLAN